MMSFSPGDVVCLGSPRWFEFDSGHHPGVFEQGDNVLVLSSVPAFPPKGKFHVYVMCDGIIGQIPLMEWVDEVLGV